MKARWVPHDTRDEVVDTVRYYAELTGVAAKRFIPWLGIGRSKFYDWRRRFGKANEHNALVPRDHWLEDWERQAIIRFHQAHAEDGYRRMTFMMQDRDIVAVSPATTYRVLSRAGLLRRWNAAPSKKGTGFDQPLSAHEHWHIDISHVNIRGTFFYLCDVLDGYSRNIVHWDIRASMTEADVEIILQKACEKFPDARPRIISDNGPQFIAKDFKQFIRLRGMTHVRTSPYYPQSNGKIERFHKTIKTECIRPKTPLSLEQAQQTVRGYIDYYNNERLHDAISFIAPRDKLQGNEKAIFATRDQRLDDARRRRKIKRQEARAAEAQTAALTNPPPGGTLHATGETDAGSAGKQPARDNRPRPRRNIDPGAARPSRSHVPANISEMSPMPTKIQTLSTLNQEQDLSNSR